MDFEHFQCSPLQFIRALTVRTSHGDRRFDDVMADFQREAFEALEASLLAVAAGEPPPRQRFWLERTKGASKDSDLACCLIWLLAFSPRAVRVQVAAGDQDQADEVRQIIRGLLRLEGEANEFAAGLLEVQGDRVINQHTLSAAEILTRDASGTHGARPDVLIINELSHIPDEEFASTAADNLDKMPAGLGIIATNAGFSPSWQERWQQIALESPRWWTQRFRQPAHWIGTDDLHESEQRNSRSRFRRLWWGEWASGGGDALDRDLIQAACVLDGPHQGPQPGFVYCLGGDLGLRKHSSALVVLGRHIGHSTERPRPQRRKSSLRAALEDLYPDEFPDRDEPEMQFTPGDQALHLAAVQVFTPTGGGSVSLDAVEQVVAGLHATFGLLAAYFDQWQAAHLVERLRARGVPAAGIDPTGPTKRAEAQAVLDGFRERTFRLYPEAALLADLQKLRIEERSYGMRLVAPETSDGEGTAHADTASAFSLATLAAHRCAGIAVPTIIQGDLLTYP